MGRELNLMHLWTCKILIFWSIYKFCPHFPPQTYSAVSRIPTFAPSPSLFFTISSSLGRKVVKNMGIILKPPVLMGCVCSFGGCHLVAVSDSCHRPALLCQSQVGGETGHLQVQHLHLEQGSGEGQSAQSKTLCKSIKTFFDLEWWSFKQYQKVIFFKPWSSIDSGPGLQFPKLLHTSPGETVKLKFILKG